jgi:tetratricopeptide (TPR) repeat protein
MMIYQENQQWSEADDAYRKSAQIKEEKGNIPGAANTYGQLGILNLILDDPEQAERWYKKALNSYQLVKDKFGESRQLNNLAHLLSTQPSRLSESKQLAIEALEIKKTLDPIATKIWKTYDLLAKIATTQGERPQAKKYRQLAKSTKTAYQK